MNALLFFTMLFSGLTLAAIVYYGELLRGLAQKTYKIAKEFEIVNPPVEQSINDKHSYTLGLETNRGIEMQAKIDEAGSLEEAIDIWLKLNNLDIYRYDKDSKTFFGWPIVEVKEQPIASTITKETKSKDGIVTF